jgi:hypothetical protein
MDFVDMLLPWNVFSLLFSGMWTLVSIGGYVWIALCLYIIAKKTNTENPWMAWIPIANIILACQIAGKPWWWIFLFFIPIVNIVLGIIVMWKICEVRGKPGWLGILMIVPIANLIIPGILAFTD